MKNYNKNYINGLFDQIINDDNQEAYKSLLQEGLDILPTLVLIMSDETQSLDRRIVAINLLGEMGVEDGIEAIVAGLDSSNDRIRKACANTLNWFNLSAKSRSNLLNAYSSSKDDYTRSQILFALGQTFQKKEIAPINIFQLVKEALKDKSWLVQQKAIEVLGKLDTEAAVPLLLSMLKTSKHEVVSAAVSALASIKDPKTVEPLINLYNNSINILLKKQILISLGLISDEQAFIVVIEALRNENIEIREAAAISLGYFKRKEPFELLFNTITNDTPLVAGAAAESLGRTLDNKACDILINLLETNTPFLVKVGAIKGLGELRSSKAYNELRKILNSANPDFRYQAAISLGKIGDSRALDALEKLARNDHTEITLIQSGITVAQGAEEAIKNIKLSFLKPRD